MKTMFEYVGPRDEEVGANPEIVAFLDDLRVNKGFKSQNLTEDVEEMAVLYIKDNDIYLYETKGTSLDDEHSKVTKFDNIEELLGYLKDNYEMEREGINII